MTWESVDLPEPFGPMIACTSPLFTVSESPWRISRSSTRTCRFLTSNSGITFFRFYPRPEERRRRVSKDETDNFLIHPSRRPLRGLLRMRRLSNRSFQRDRDQLLRLDCEFHRQLLQHVLDKAVDDETDRLFLAQSALHAIEQHVLGNLRGGGFVLEQRR